MRPQGEAGLGELGIGGDGFVLLGGLAVVFLHEQGVVGHDLGADGRIGGLVAVFVGRGEGLDRFVVVGLEVAVLGEVEGGAGEHQLGEGVVGLEGESALEALDGFGELPGGFDAGGVLARDAEALFEALEAGEDLPLGAGVVREAVAGFGRGLATAVGGERGLPSAVGAAGLFQRAGRAVEERAEG